MIKPKQDHLVLEIEQVKTGGEEVRASGLIIKKEANPYEKQNKGVVVAVGPGRRTLNGDLIAIDAKIGETVLFNAFAGTEIKIDEKLFLVIRECDILATI